MTTTTKPFAHGSRGCRAGAATGEGSSSAHKQMLKQEAEKLKKDAGRQPAKPPSAPAETSQDAEVTRTARAP